MESESAVLHGARMAAGLTQRALAERADTTQAMIARYETGAASPRASAKSFMTFRGARSGGGCRGRDVVGRR